MTNREIEFGSFEEFYPYYISQHSKSATRIMHVTGTSLGVVNAVWSLAAGRPAQLLLTPVLGYGFAWFSHFVIEHNKPASFGYPLYSFQGDWKMVADMYRGRNQQLGEMAQEYLEKLATDRAIAEAAAAEITETSPEVPVTVPSERQASTEPQSSPEPQSAPEPQAAPELQSSSEPLASPPLRSGDGS